MLFFFFENVRRDRTLGYACFMVYLSDKEKGEGIDSDVSVKNLSGVEV